MKRRSRPMPPARDRDNSGYRDDYREPPVSQGGGGGSKGGFNIAIVAGIFVIGIVLGVIVTYTASFSGGDSITTDLEIAKLAPNPELCAQYGASAIVTETRTFVTLNPRRVFVSQPQTLPGCVLRSSNWNVLKQKDAVTSDDISSCRNRMNTFGYTGDIEVLDKAEVDCIYQNDGQRRF